MKKDLTRKEYERRRGRLVAEYEELEIAWRASRHFLPLKKARLTGLTSKISEIVGEVSESFGVREVQAWLKHAKPEYFGAVRRESIAVILSRMEGISIRCVRHRRGPIPAQYQRIEDEAGDRGG